MNSIVYLGILVRFSLSVGIDILLSFVGFTKALLKSSTLLGRKIPSVVKFAVVGKSI